MSAVARLERHRDIHRKSLLDYRLALKSCYDKTDAQWIAILEDDVLAQRDWYENTMKSLQKIVDWRQQGRIRDWLYLRLFYTDKFLGWNSEEWPIYLFCSISIFTAVTGTLIIGRKKSRSVRELATVHFLVIICFVFLPLLIGLFFLSGRVTMRPLQPGIHVMNRYGCCSQAMVFPRDKAPLLMEHLRQMGRGRISMAVDTAIEQLADEHGLDRLVLVPSQMQHVGAASYKEDLKENWSKPYRVRGAHGVWSMSFEEAYD
jgi:GR25 family glycosyltransferase involved in LPS biosynthesis